MEIVVLVLILPWNQLDKNVKEVINFKIYVNLHFNLTLFTKTVVCINWGIFVIEVCLFMSLFFYLHVPVNTNEPNFIAFFSWYLVAKKLLHLSLKILSSKTFMKQDAVLTPVLKQWIAKDTPSYGGANQNAWKLLSTDFH